MLFQLTLLEVWLCTCLVQEAVNPSIPGRCLIFDNVALQQHMQQQRDSEAAFRAARWLVTPSDNKHRLPATRSASLLESISTEANHRSEHSNHLDTMAHLLPRLNHSSLKLIVGRNIGRHFDTMAHLLYNCFQIPGFLIPSFATPGCLIPSFWILVFHPRLRPWTSLCYTGSFIFQPSL